MAKAYHHVTAAGAGSKNGSSWANAFGEGEFEAHVEANGAADDVFWIMEGTYTLNSSYDWSAKDGTAALPIHLIGVKATTTNTGANVVYTDWAMGTERPYFVCGAYTIVTGDYCHIRNIHFETTNTNAIQTQLGGLNENCKFNNARAGSGNTAGLTLSGNYDRLINCELTSATGTSIWATAYTFIYGNYFHDIPDGTGGQAIVMGGNLITIINNIFDNVRVCINGAAYPAISVINNTVYGGATFLSLTTASALTAINNLADSTTSDVFISTSQIDNSFYWKNHGNDARCTDMWHGVDVSLLCQDYAVTTGDPLFTTAGSDFSLTTTSPCIGNGFSISQGVGAGGLSCNKGAWQSSIDEATRNISAGIENILSTAHEHILNVEINGVYHEATTAEVQDGVMFGSGSILEGTYTGAGGGAGGAIQQHYMQNI